MQKAGEKSCLTNVRGHYNIEFTLYSKPYIPQVTVGMNAAAGDVVTVDQHKGGIYEYIP